MHHGKRKSSSNGRIYGIAARFENLDAGVGGKVVDADDHAMAGARGLLVEVWDHVCFAFLGWGSWTDEEGACREGQNWAKSNHGVL
jgi:hypothetical protein